MSSKKMKNEVSTKCRAYYIKNVNINYSFKSLENLAEERGAKLAEGDIIVVDNEKGDKRKLLKVTKSGAIIMYAKLLKDIFHELPSKAINESALDLLDYTK